MILLRRMSPIVITLLMGVMLAASAAAKDPEDSITAWKRWKSIEAAIELRPLDDPSDIIEKAEIIEDRVDELIGEKTRLEHEYQVQSRLLQTWKNQREVLIDLAEIRQGGDSQMRLRIHDLTERIRREENLLSRISESIDGLKKEIDRLKNLDARYREKAEELRIREGGAQ